MPSAIGPIAGAAAGALFSGGSKSSSQEINQDPWGPQQPYLQYGFQQAQNLYNSGGPAYYPGATYVPFAQQTENALGMMQNRAMQGSPVEGAMQNYVTGTLGQAPGGGTMNYLQSQMGAQPGIGGGSMGAIPYGAMSSTAQGQMLGANPYLDSQYDAAARRVTENFTDSVIPNITGMFAGGGGTGSGIHREMNLDAADVLGRNLSDMASSMYGQNYARERGLQMNAANMMNQDALARRSMNIGQDQFYRNLGLGAAGAANQLTGIQGDIQRGAAALAPTAANFDWQNIDRLRGVGAEVEGMAGNVLGDSMDRFNYYQNRPEANLAHYIAAIQGNYGGQAQQTTSQPGGSRVAGALGGGLLGYELQNSGMLDGILGSLLGGGGSASNFPSDPDAWWG